LPDWRFSLTSTNNSVNAYEVDALPIPRFERLEIDALKRPPVDWKRWAGILCPGPSGVSDWEQAVLEEMSRTPASAAAWPDTVHDALATAGKEMSRLGEERQKLSRDFADWLFQTLKADADAFTGITHLKGGQADFDELGWDHFFDLLERNHRVCQVAPDHCAHLVKARFSEVAADLQANRSRFSSLDAAIDRIVWQLVGLNRDGSLP
jgi:hypothetical protein